MHFSTIFLHGHSKSLYTRLTFLRWMGGGPRTFPGGLNKWQWKRMHEKKARDKEKRLLSEEKQVYQARIRSEIRAKLASAEALISGNGNLDQNNPNYGPITPELHVKALADRFMKVGAEDLWNENDGPSASPENKPEASLWKGEVTDMRSNNTGAEEGKRGFSRYAGVVKPRHFSTYTGRGDGKMVDLGNEYLRTRNGGFDLMGSCSRGPRFMMGISNGLYLKCDYSVGSASYKGKSLNFVRKNSRIDGQEAEDRFRGGKRAKWPRFHGGRMDSSDDDTDDEDDEDLGGGTKIVSSSAALGKYDIKTKKRVPLKFLENEDDLSQQIEVIRKEMKERKAMQEEEKEKGEEEPLLSNKRFDECGVSTLTVQALAEAGYVQMTRVQEATLSACLEGRDALVKARAGTGKSVAFLF